MINDLSDLALDEDVDKLSEELKLYFQNKFYSKEPDRNIFITDNSAIHIWEDYCLKAAKENAFSLLKRCYPQLNFPVEKDINKSQEYISAVLKGKRNYLRAESNKNFNKAESICIAVHECITGKVPVLIIPDEEDFIKFVQCVLYKNNPVSVPLSMGALLVNGINNWNRIDILKERWLEDNPSGSWNQEFSTNVLPNPGLYKDTIIILSTKPYSNVTASSLGLSDDAWKSYSFSIRLAHECTHLYTLKRYGCASNNLHDELVADYIGITRTLGRYNKEWMLAFMGLEKYPTYREGARLENYLGNTDMSFENFSQLINIIRRAIDTLAGFDIELGTIKSDDDYLCRIDSLCETDFLTISSRHGLNALLQKYTEISKRHLDKPTC